MFKIVVFLISVLLNFSARADPKVIINDVGWPPYFFIGEKAPQQGLGKELLNLCVQQAGYTIEYRRLPVKRTHLYMKNGDIDITVYSYLKQREKFLTYSQESLFSSDFVFMVKAGSGIVINDLKDLAPLKIGRLAGLSYTPKLMEIIKNKDKKHQVVTGYNFVSMFSQLLAPVPRFDIIANSKSTLYWQAKALKVSDKVKILDYTITSKDYLVTVSKKSKNVKNPVSFLKQIDSCLRMLKSNGNYKTILANYGYKYTRK